MREKLERINKSGILLKEEDYLEKMSLVVRPCLEEYHKAGYFQSYDGIKLYYECYKQPKATVAVVMCHGFCEFTKKFDEVIYYFLQAGYSVYILDHRGHGYSKRSVKDKDKVHVGSYDEYVLDFESFITNIVLKECSQQKLVLYAHSMGGAIAALYLEQYQQRFSCAILSSPMLEINLNQVPTFLVWLILLFKKLTKTDKAYVMGHGSFDGSSRFQTSCCLSEARYQRIINLRKEDENYRTHGATYGWTLASLKAIRKLQKNASKVETPILLIQAGKDTTVKQRGQKLFAQNTRNTTIELIPEAKHEIYNSNTEILEKYFDIIFNFIESSEQ